MSVMLILRGIANGAHPRGQLDDASALEYARRVGYVGEVLNVAGATGRYSTQVERALIRIRQLDLPLVGALYGFSGGGYNARHIWARLNSIERARIRKVVVLGASDPGVATKPSDFPGCADLTIRGNPPAGHLAGPKALLDSLPKAAPPPAPVTAPVAPSPAAPVVGWLKALFAYLKPKGSA